MQAVRSQALRQESSQPGIVNPYRSHSAFNERRVRRLIRKQTRLDKRLMQRAEVRFRRELNGERARDLTLLVIACIGFVAYAMVLLSWPPIE